MKAAKKSAACTNGGRNISATRAGPGFAMFITYPTTWPERQLEHPVATTVMVGRGGG